MPDIKTKYTVTCKRGVIMKKQKLSILILVSFILLVGCSLFERDKGNPYSKSIIYSDRVESEWAEISYKIPDGHECTDEILLALEIEMDSKYYATDQKVSTDIDYEMASLDEAGNNVVVMSMKVSNEKGKKIDFKRAEKEILRSLKSGSNSEWSPSEVEFCGSSYNMYETNFKDIENEDLRQVIILKELGDNRIIVILFTYYEQEDFSKMWDAFEPLQETR